MRYELIDKNNLILATRVELEIFPEEIAFSAYKKSIEDNHQHYKFYLVYNENVIVGITGIYMDIKYPDSIWLGWYGVLEEYRLHGFGKQILLDSIEMAKEWAKNDKKISYMRIYTSYKYNDIAQILYKEFMDTTEEYNNKEDINFNNTCLIYSKSLKDNINIELWNNKFLDLKHGVEMVDEGLKEFTKLTNGDIHIQIAPTGEVF